MSWMNENLCGIHDMLNINSLLLVAFICSDGSFCASLGCLTGCLIVPGMNTIHLSLVWLASMVANGDDTNGPEHSQESAAAAR